MAHITLIKAREPKIIIKISAALTEEQRSHPVFVPLLEQQEQFFNCSCPDCFSDVYRLRLCLHEAGHIIYMRDARATKITFYGPEIIWDARNGVPAISRSSVEWTPPRIARVDSVATGRNLKPFIASFIFREKLAVPNDEIAIGMDMDDARQWFDEYVGTGDAGFDAAFKESRDEIIKDLRSPAFKKKAWDTAREFSREVFGCASKN
jgi:hypothetical protein